MAAVGFALFAFLIYLVKQKQQGACNSSFFSAKSAEVCNATYRVQVDGKNKRREKIVLSKELTDKATGIKIPRHQKFGKSQLTCLGVGVRAKSIAIAKVNVYSVALYVEDKPARHALKKFRGEDPRTLSNDDSVFYALGAHNSFGGGFKKYLHLVFARPVGATKIVDALTSVKDVDEDVLARYVYNVIRIFVFWVHVCVDFMCGRVVGTRVDNIVDLR